MPTCGLLFDVDGVIANTEPICARAASAMFRDRYGAEVPERAFARYVGNGPSGYLNGPARDHGFEVDVDTAWPDTAARFLSILDETEASIAFPRVQAFVREALVKDGWRVGLATSTPENKFRKTLAAAGVDPEAFAAYIHGGCVKRHKPHPDIYMAAAEALGLAPDCCVVIEDAIDGIRAAKGAGMHCIAVTNSFPADRLCEADAVVDHIGEITWSCLARLVVA